MFVGTVPRLRAAQTPLASLALLLSSFGPIMLFFFGGRPSSLAIWDSVCKGWFARTIGVVRAHHLARCHPHALWTPQEPG